MFTEAELKESKALSEYYALPKDVRQEFEDQTRKSFVPDSENNNFQSFRKEAIVDLMSADDKAARLDKLEKSSHTHPAKKEAEKTVPAYSDDEHKAAPDKKQPHAPAHAEHLNHAIKRSGGLLGWLTGGHKQGHSPDHHPTNTHHTIAKPHVATKHYTPAKKPEQVAPKATVTANHNAEHHGAPLSPEMEVQRTAVLDARKNGQNESEAMKAALEQFHSGGNVKKLDGGHHVDDKFAAGGDSVKPKATQSDGPKSGAIYHG